VIVRAFLFAALLAVLPLGGCQLLPPSVAENAARAVRHYCAEPLDIRQGLRASINAMIAPASIAVTCEGDELPPLEPDAEPDAAPAAPGG
jgi:hypothetical protein